MSNDKARLSLSKPRHSLLDQDFGARVDVTRRLVQNEDVPVREEGSCDGEQLLLSRRQIRRVLVDLGGVSVRKRANETVDMRGLRGLENLIVARLGPTVTDVVTDRAGEHPCVLEDHGVGASNFVSSELRVVDSSEQDATRVNLVEAHEQIYDRGFASASWSDDGDGVARGHFETEVLDERLVSVITETHVVQCDVTIRTGRQDSWRVAILIKGLLVGVEEFEDPFRRRDAGLEHVHLGRDLGDRHG